MNGPNIITIQVFMSELIGLVKLIRHEQQIILATKFGLMDPPHKCFQKCVIFYVFLHDIFYDTYGLFLS